MYIQLQVNTVNKTCFKNFKVRISNVAKETTFGNDCLKFTNENDIRLKFKIYPQNTVILNVLFN